MLRNNRGSPSSWRYSSWVGLTISGISVYDRALAILNRPSNNALDPAPPPACAASRTMWTITEPQPPSFAG